MRVRFSKIRYAGMLQYDGEIKLPSQYLVSPPEIERTSGEHLVYNGVRTSPCSETVKFGHVTFFWNGNRSGYFNSELEEYVEIPSASGVCFNVQPKMKAVEIAEKARDAILSGKFFQVRANLPNGDIVGHTGDIEAIVVACKPADEAVKVPLQLGLAPGVRFRKDLSTDGLANVASTVINLHGFEALADYEPTLIEVVDN